MFDFCPTGDYLCLAYPGMVLTLSKIHSLTANLFGLPSAVLILFVLKAC